MNNKEGDIRKNNLRNKFKQFFGKKKNIIVFFTFILIVLFAFTGKLICGHEYDECFKGYECLEPLWQRDTNLANQFILGTDFLGRDMVARLSKATQISLLVGLFSSAIVCLKGVVLGLLSGSIGGKIDKIIVRYSEIIYCIPDVLIVILLSSVLNPILSNYINNHIGEPFADFLYEIGSSIIGILLAFYLIYWVNVFKIVRGQVILIKNMEYVKISKMSGGKHGYILKKHILPNILPTVITTTFLQIPVVIFLESFLSFLGLGINASLTSLGALASDGMNYIYSKTYLLMEPIVMMGILVFSLNVIGMGIREVFNGES